MLAVCFATASGFAALGQSSEYLMYPDGATQLGWQVVAMLVTVAIGVSGEGLGVTHTGV